MESILYLLYAVVVLMSLFGVYLIYCLITLIMFGAKTNDNPDKCLEIGTKFNIFIWLIKRKYRKKLSKDNSKHKLKKQIRKKEKLDIILFIINTYLLMGVVVLTINVYLMFTAEKAVSAVVTSVIASDEEEEEGEEEDDPFENHINWLYNKPQPQNNTNQSSSNTGYIPGKCTSQYAVQLFDGTYYWYHQSSEDCVYNVTHPVYGRLGTLHAGGQKNDTMAEQGCGLYSTAMLLSNLLGEDITPFEVIENVFNCEIKLNSNGEYYFDTPSSENGIIYTTNAPTWNPDKMAERINEAYGDKGVVAQSVKWSRENVDAYFDNPDIYAYMLTSYKGTFDWYRSTKGGTHFMVARKASDGKYYCFTSVSGNLGYGHEGAVNAMNAGQDWDTVERYNRHPDNVLIVYRDKSCYPTSTVVSTTGYNQEVYDTLSNDPEFSDKALPLATAYAVIEPVYGRNFAIGVMANIQEEGTFGLIEGNWGSEYWNYVSSEVLALANTIITNISQVDTLLNGIPDPVKDTKIGEGVGVGIIQWSGGRRQGLLERYKATGKTDFSEGDLAEVEIAYMLEELSNTYYDSVIAPCEGKSATECASKICLNYEKPKDKYTRAAARANIASRLESTLSGVTTSGATSQQQQQQGQLSSSTGNSVVDTALKYVGSKYVYGGKNIDTGIDCSAFVSFVHKEVGYDKVSGTSSWLRETPLGIDIDINDTSQWQPGDVLCFKGHVGIYIGNPEPLEITDRFGNKVTVPAYGMVHASDTPDYKPDQSGGGVKVSGDGTAEYWHHYSQPLLKVKRFTS